MMFDPCPAYLNAQRCSGKPALQWAGRSIAWEALHNYVHSTSRYLKEIAVKPDTRHVVVIDNSPAFIIVILALWRIRAVPCPVSPLLSQAQASEVCSCVRPASVISGRKLRPVWDPLLRKGRWADIEHVVAYGYNDSFLGSEAALDPKLDQDYPAIVRITFPDHLLMQDFAGSRQVKLIELTHAQLRKDPGEFSPLFHSFATGEPFKIN